MRGKRCRCRRISTDGAGYVALIQDGLQARQSVVCHHVGEPSACICILGPVHANNGLALAARRAERKDCDEANTRCIREEHDAAIGPSGGQPREGFFNQGNVPFRPHCGVGHRLSPKGTSFGAFGSAKRRSFLLALRAERHVRKPVISVNRP